MLRVGIAGFGFMGKMHYGRWSRLGDVRVVAICDANRKIFEDIDKVKGNIEGVPERIDLSSLKLYTDFEKMLADEKPDAVSITLPTHLHAVFAIKALEAGVNVLCEKPMALTVEECSRMMEAARRSGKKMMIGHCVRFWPEYAKTKEFINSGQYGSVLAAGFQRLGSRPGWSKDNWFTDENRSGGMVMDLHIHDTDYIQYLFGVPQAVVSRQADGSDGGAIHVVTQYLYDDNRLVSAEGGWCMMPSFGFEMSFNIMLERATIVYDCTRQPTFRICTADGEVLTPAVSAATGYQLEIEHFCRMLNGQTVPEVTTLEQSRESVRIVHAEKESARTGEKVVL